MSISAAQTKKLETRKTENNFEGFLFDINAFGPGEDIAERKARQKAANKVCAKIYKVRRESLADGADADFLEGIDRLIREIKFMSNLTNSQRTELVLYAIEKCQCITIPEIVEETHLTNEEVKRLVEELKAKDLVYEAKRFVPFSGRQYFALKSRRVYTPEADEVFEKSTSVFDFGED